MKKISKETGIRKTNGDFGSDKSGVTVACGCSCSCIVFIGAGIGGIIGLIVGLIKGAMSGFKLVKEIDGTFKKYTLGFIGSILFAIAFGFIGILVGGGLGLLVDTMMGNF